MMTIMKKEKRRRKKKETKKQTIWLLLPLSHSLSRGDEDEKDDGNEQMKKHTIWLLDDDIYEDTHPFFLQTISQSERRISENP